MQSYRKIFLFLRSILFAIFVILEKISNTLCGGRRKKALFLFLFIIISSLLLFLSTILFQNTLMNSRTRGLNAAIEGYQKTGILLTSITNNGNLQTVDPHDDQGIYLLNSLLSNLISSSADRSHDILMILFSLLSISFGTKLFYSLFKSNLSFFSTAIFYLFLNSIFIRIGDTYFFLGCGASILFPLILLVDKKNDKFSSVLLLGVLTGIFCGLFNQMRIHAGTPFIITTLYVLIKKNSLSFFQRVVIMTTFTLIPLFIFPSIQRVLSTKLDQYMSTQVQSYKPHTRKGHHLWHNIYIGLGYLENNQYKIKYSDGVAAKKVEELSPGTIPLSKEYDDVLKKEIWRIAQESPLFIFKVFSVKLLKIAFYTLVALQFSIFFLPYVFNKTSNKNKVIIFLLLTISMAPGLLTIPTHAYLAGYISICYLIGYIVLIRYYSLDTPEKQ